MRLFRLHHQSFTHSIAGLRRLWGCDRSCLSYHKFGCCSNCSFTVILRIETRQSIIQAEIDSSVGNYSEDGNSEAVIKTEESFGSSGSLDEAISEAAKVSSAAGSDVCCQSSPSLAQRLHEAQYCCACQSTWRHVGHKELEKLLVLVYLREHTLDRIFDGEIQCLTGKLSQNGS